LYSEICEKTISEDGFGQVMGGDSFATTTTHGDGSYPVIGFTNEDGKISQILIDFEPEFEDDEEL